MRRSLVALAAALAVHALFAVSLGRVSWETSVSTTTVVEFDVRETSQATRPPLDETENAKPAGEKSGERSSAAHSRSTTAGANRAGERSESSHEKPEGVAKAESVQAQTGEAKSESAGKNAEAVPGTPDLFPSGVLEKFSTGGGPSWGGRTINQGNRAEVEAEERGRAEAALKARVAGWAKQEVAQNDAKAGRINPVWRAMERDLAETFHPPPDLVKEGGRARTGLNQLLRAFGGGAEDRARRASVHGHRYDDQTLPGKSVDPSQQGFLGDPAGLNSRSSGFEQQFAAQESLSAPNWVEVEIEIETDEKGNVAQARVVSPSGRRAFDRYALEAVKRRVANGRAEPRTLSRWQIAAAQSVDGLKIGGTFDENAIFDKRARKNNSAMFPLHKRMNTRIQLAWVQKLDG